jgi:hypothetical protein
LSVNPRRHRNRKTIASANARRKIVNCHAQKEETAFIATSCVGQITVNTTRGEKRGFSQNSQARATGLEPATTGSTVPSQLRFSPRKCGFDGNDIHRNTLKNKVSCVATQVTLWECLAARDPGKHSFTRMELSRIRLLEPHMWWTTRSCLLNSCVAKKKRWICIDCLLHPSRCKLRKLPFVHLTNAFCRGDYSIDPTARGF